MPLLSKKARIAAAVKDFQEGKFPSKRRAAQAHDIDHKTLAANLVAPTGKSGGHNKVLNEAQEEALREYCDCCMWGIVELFEYNFSKTFRNVFF